MLSPGILRSSVVISSLKPSRQTVKEDSCHKLPLEGSRNRVIISDICRQLSSSAASCFRPARVIE